MSGLVLYGAVGFTLAFLFYSVGIWAEFFARRLKPWHLAAFFLGVVCDTTATGFMVRYVGGMLVNLHGLVGALGLGLMIAHFLWAAAVLWWSRHAPDSPAAERAVTGFHRYSVAVWAVWMLAYLSGIYLGMQ